MEGKFNKPLLKYFYCLLFILTGSFTTIKLSLWGIGEIQKNHISAAVFCFGFSFLGLLFILFSIFIFQFNKGAFLIIDNNSIKARFGWKRMLNTNISDIKNVSIKNKNLELFIGNETIWISGLSNVKEIYEYLFSRISESYSDVNIDEAQEKLNKHKKSYMLYLIFTIVTLSFMYLNIAWCVFLTEGKNLTKFNSSNNFVFFAFVFAEICTILAAFILADKRGKELDQFKMCKSAILFATASEHKYDSLDKYSNLITKKYFEHNTYRIVIFSPYDDVFAYMLEKFEMKTLSWIECYESAKVFEILSELYNDIDNAFSDFILKD